MRNIVGAEVIGGNYHDEIAGMPAIVGKQPSGVAAQIRARNSVLVEDQPYSKWRRQMLPVPSVNLTAAGGVGSVQVQPQRLFKGKKITIQTLDTATGAAATGVVITSVKIGQNEQFVADGDIPSVVFAADAVSSFVDLDDANIGNLVTVTFRNDNPTTDITASGAIFGLIVE